MTTLVSTIGAAMCGNTFAAAHCPADTQKPIIQARNKAIRIVLVVSLMVYSSKLRLKDSFQVEA